MIHKRIHFVEMWNKDYQFKQQGTVNAVFQKIIDDILGSGWNVLPAYIDFDLNLEQNKNSFNDYFSLPLIKFL